MGLSHRVGMTGPTQWVGHNLYFFCIAPNKTWNGIIPHNTNTHRGVLKTRLIFLTLEEDSLKAKKIKKY